MRESLRSCDVLCLQRQHTHTDNLKDIKSQLSESSSTFHNTVPTSTKGRAVLCMHFKKTLDKRNLIHSFGLIASYGTCLKMFLESKICSINLFLSNFGLIFYETEF